MNRAMDKNELDLVAIPKFTADKLHAQHYAAVEALREAQRLMTELDRSIKRAYDCALSAGTFNPIEPPVQPEEGRGGRYDGINEKGRGEY